MFSTDDTIVAIATPPGRGGIGVVRLSGPDAVEIACALTGREAPYAMLMYVVSNDLPVGTLLPNPHTDRIQTPRSDRRSPASAGCSTAGAHAGCCRTTWRPCTSFGAAKSMWSTA